MNSKRMRALQQYISSSSKPRSNARNRGQEKRRRRRRLAASFESLERRNLLTFAIDLFADINLFGVSSIPSEIVPLGDTTYFVADDGVTGSELWKTDGTSDGTMLVADLLPGADGSSPSNLTVLGDDLYFTALDDTDESDLWKVDGTTGDTVRVFDANAAGVYLMYDLTASGTKLFFTALENATGYELWVHDGTTGATQLVKDINRDQDVPDRPQELTDVNGTLFFTSYDNGYDNRELWKTDGSDAGTMMVADLGIDDSDPNNIDTGFSSNPTQLTNVDGVLYFAAEDFNQGIELFKSGGDAATTMMIEDLNPNDSSFPREITPFAGQVFFTAENGTNGRQLYSTNGTTITPGAITAPNNESSDPAELTVVGNELFFAAEGKKPATSVSALTPILTPDNSNTSSAFVGVFVSVERPDRGVLGRFGGSRTINAQTQDGGDDGPGWVASGARIGATNVPLSTIAPNDAYFEDIDSTDLAVDVWEWTVSDPGGLTNIQFAGFASGNEYDEANEGLLFELFLNNSPTRTSFDEVFGDDLDNWNADRDAGNIAISDPGGAAITTATVRMTFRRDGGPEVLPNGGNEAVLVNAVLTADLQPATTTTFVSAGRELHKTDGTVQGTEMVKDIVPIGTSDPTELTESGGKLFFSADDVTVDGRELWVSDGMEAGTTRLLDSRPGVADSGAPFDGDPQNLTDFGGKLLFTTQDDLNDRELWVAEGDPLTASLLKNINPSTVGANVKELLEVGNTLYFIADDGVHGEAVWTANLVTEEVTMVADVTPLSTDKVSGLTEYNGQVAFYNDSFGLSGGIFLTNGTGTPTLLSSLRPTPFNDDGDLFVSLSGSLFFVADDGVNGEELWSSFNGGAATRREINPNQASSSPRELVALNNFIYFAATGPTNGREVYFGDAFSISSMDINQGSGSSNPENFVRSGSRVYFAADNGSIGRELWSTTGFTPSLVADIRSGANSSSPHNLTDVNGTLYFAANNGSNGVEPHRSNGNPGNAVMVGNINNGSSNPSGFLSHNGRVYFTAEQSSTGRELWSTDGTTSTIVADVNPGPASSEATPLLDIGNRLIFAASSTAASDNEPWSTDGTAAKTIQIEDLKPSVFASSNPDEMVEINGTIYFVADNGSAGRELFKMTRQAPVVSGIAISLESGELPVVDSLQRSTVDRITLAFDSVVELPANAITLRNRTTNTDVTSLQIDVSTQQGQTIVEITFGSGPSVLDRDPSSTNPSGLLNSLVDGYYDLRVAAAGISSIESGAIMAADLVHGDEAVDRFYRYFGDRDGDGDVDINDYTLFSRAYNRVLGHPLYDDSFDLIGDGDVDINDYTPFTTRYNRALNFS